MEDLDIFLTPLSVMIDDLCKSYQLHLPQRAEFLPQSEHIYILSDK